ncbi:N-acetyltransferase family protein [Actinomadura darangshiensis]|uniref:N-acetyltransferase family protein n=2 Tax=Actinomadura darangshiensis TaxID=705336 RepID=A0A4R5B3V5_9ACTN|nr:N-acetyltransferase family protein [Actinomadura darangshiensis]
MNPLYDSVVVRPGRVADAESIRTIRNDAIEHTTAIWTTVKQTPEDAAAWWAELIERRAAFVAEAGGEVLGYASWTQWRPKEGYRFTVENSVYVLPGHQGEGIGGRLMRTLIAAARESGAHVMLADIEAGNTASIALHKRLGFETAGTLREIGTKFGRRLDLTIMRLALAP